MQVICTLLQTDSHAITSSLKFFYGQDALSATHLTASKHCPFHFAMIYLHFVCSFFNCQSLRCCGFAQVAKDGWFVLNINIGALWMSSTLRHCCPLYALACTVVDLKPRDCVIPALQELQRGSCRLSCIGTGRISHIRRVHLGPTDISRRCTGMMCTACFDTWQLCLSPYHVVWKCCCWRKPSASSWKRAYCSLHTDVTREQTYCVL